MLFGPEAGSGTYIDILTYDDTSMTGIENGSVSNDRTFSYGEQMMAANFRTIIDDTPLRKVDTPKIFIEPTTNVLGGDSSRLKVHVAQITYDVRSGFRFNLLYER